VKHVALVDWFWAGHHPNYFLHYAMALAYSGHTVVPFCARPQMFEASIAEKRLPQSIRRNIRPAVYTHRQTQSPEWVPRRFQSVFGYICFYLRLRRQLYKWERDNKTCINSVFFACIYDGDFQHFHLVQHFFGFRWSGLYLHARKFRIPNSEIPYWGIMPCPERIFRNRLLTSIAVLDEKAVEPLKAITTGKPVYIYPDLANTDLPTDVNQEPLVKHLQQVAGERPIISLVGHLQWTKGFTAFTQAAASPRMQSALFFLGGEISWSQVSDEDRALLEKAWSESPNIYTHLQHIESDLALNAIIAGSAVIVAAYISFPNSSNILTKAAAFKRPIIVSDGFLMAERVRKYNLGEVVPENDPQALASAVERMLHPDYYPELKSRAKWQEYCAAHSFEALVSAMSKAVAG
jgi:glycosyltransferase involved in cell wall biosynthesis